MGDKILNYGMLHYHCRPGGVRTVMENSAISLFKHSKYKKINMSFIGDILTHKKWVGTFDVSGHSVVNIDINELNYSFRSYKSKSSLLKDAKKIRDKIIEAIPIKDCSFENPYYLHTHNMNLGKSPVVSAAIYLLAEWAVNKPIVIILQVHDLAENGRYGLLKNLQMCTGKFDKYFAAKIMYPNKKSIIYATINQGDMDNLLEIGLDKERVFLLPNSIDVKQFEQKPLDQMSAKEIKKLGLKKINFSDKLKSRIEEYSKKHGFKFDKNKKIILSPLKCIRRKNILESILLLELLQGEYQLVVTLDASSGEDKKYSNKVKKFVKKNKLNVIIGPGQEIVAPVSERVIENGDVKFFNMDDMFEISEAVLTTSLVEGFGFVYHEAWLTNKFVFGRKIPYVTNAYEENGMDLEHMYIKLNINPKWVNMVRVRRKYLEKMNDLRRKQDYKPLTEKEFEIEFKEKKIKGGFIDFGSLDAVSQVLFLLKLSKHRKELFEINPHLFNLKIKKNVINQNKKASEKNYDFKAKAKRLEKLFENSKKLIRKPIKSKKIDNTKIIEKYMDLENIYLLV